MSGSPEWYLPDPDGLEPKGPFATSQVKRMLKSGQLRIDSYVWGSHFGEAKWLRISECDDFNDEMSKYPRLPIPKKRSTGVVKTKKRTSSPSDRKVKSGFAGNANNFRRYPRIPVEAEVLIHNGSKFCRGNTIDISEKGLFIRVANQGIFKSGDEVKVIVRGLPIVGTFYASSVVMRVNEYTVSQGLGIYFLRLNPDIKSKLAVLILERLGQEGSVFDRTGIESA